MLPSPPEGLRHWRATDAPALARAWADPAVTAWNRPPAGTSPEGWIAGVHERWRRRLALDLVIEAPGGDEVAGEVGLANFTTEPARAELGVWVAAPHRRQGLARRAVDAVTRWALSPVEEPDGQPDGGLGLVQVWARVDEGNEAAAALFASLGWQRLGSRAGKAIWAATPAVLG